MFVGEIEARDVGQTEGMVLVDGKNGEERYGSVKGVYHVTYLDEQGTEYKEDIP